MDNKGLNLLSWGLQLCQGLPLTPGAMHEIKWWKLKKKKKKKWTKKMWKVKWSEMKKVKKLSEKKKKWKWRKFKSDEK